MFDQFKVYFYAFVAIVVAGFAAVFKYRGMKIDKLESDVEYHEAKDKAQDFEKQNVEAAAKAEAQDVKDISVGTYTI